jgi:hypothetical protein
MRAGTPRGPQGEVYAKGFSGQPMGADTYGDSGGASRFFYVAKPTRKERDFGCEHLPLRSGGEATDREEDSDDLNSPRAGAGRTGGARNFHPTVKPIGLMAYLCRLVTPPGGVVLDPFVGSGTTGCGALREGFRFIGCELSPEYVEIARARVGAMETLKHEPERFAANDALPGQLGLFAAPAPKNVIALAAGCSWCGNTTEPLELVDGARACATCRRIRGDHPRAEGT